MKHATVYRLYIGLTTQDGEPLRFADCRETVVATLAETGIQGATILAGTGVWEGNTERNLVVEVVSHPPAALGGDVRRLGKRLKERFNQAAVLLTSTQVQTDLL